jgi:hypothetical protein
MQIKVFSEGLVVRASSSDGKGYDPITYANVSEQLFKKSLCNVSPYEPFTSFFFDLSIAEYYGESGIRETFSRVVKNWAGDYKYFAEFVLCLNWKIWVWYSVGCDDIGRIYDELWKQADDLIWKRYGEDEEASSYIFHVLD